MVIASIAMTDRVTAQAPAIERQTYAAGQVTRVDRTRVLGNTNLVIFFSITQGTIGTPDTDRKSAYLTGGSVTIRE